MRHINDKFDVGERCDRSGPPVRLASVQRRDELASKTDVWSDASILLPDIDQVLELEHALQGAELQVFAWKSEYSILELKYPYQVDETGSGRLGTNVRQARRGK